MLLIVVLPCVGTTQNSVDSILHDFTHVLSPTKYIIPHFGYLKSSFLKIQLRRHNLLQAFPTSFL